MANKFYKEESKKNWYTEGAFTIEHIQTGALQRIADATELMAKNFLGLQNDVALYKRWYEEGRDRGRKKDKVIAALKGHITRLKKQQPAK